MFKGLKKAVKGGISTVSEQGSGLASKVAGDSLDLKDRITSEAKRGLQGGVEYVAEGTKKVQETPATEYKDRTKEVAHRVKHYGALGEDYLGYSDPSKELRKAVKAKEKAAKKAKKEKKKKGIKEEDLFSPENLAKFKKELEERRRNAELAQEISPDKTGEDHNGEQGEGEEERGTGNREGLQLELTLPAAAAAVTTAVPQAWSNEASPEFGPPVVEEPIQGDLINLKSPGGVTPGKSPRDDNDGWKRFTELTSGIDQLLKEKQSKLEEIKSSSYYQRKKTQVEILEDSKVERSENLVGKRKKQWADLDAEGFEEKEGIVAGDQVSDTESVTDDNNEEGNQDQQWVDNNQESEEEEEDDFFNTAFVDAIVSGDIKLNVIPDSPEPAEDDDPFNTKFADTIVEKHAKEKAYREKVESNKVKFGSIAAAADVLTGRADKLDKHSVDHAVKKKRRRANRINLIGDEVDDVTAVEDIDGVDVNKVEESLTEDIFGSGGDDLGVPVADLLSSSVSPVPSATEVKFELENEDLPKSQKLSEDLKEFDLVLQEEGTLTSNVAILAAEFSSAQQEEEDPFDEAFDLLAKESINKFALADIEKDLNDEDLFDTTRADVVLNLASIANVNKKKVEEESPIDEFDDDRDPFDTTAFEHLTKSHEEDLEFDFLAKRDPHETVGTAESQIDTAKDPFEVVAQQLSTQNSTEESSWAQFGGGPEKKKTPPARPSKPPPPRPPRPPPTPRVEIDYASGRNTPSVIIKAPSSESIKSWNNTQAENLIRKSKIEGLETEILEQEKEFDPFDTTEYTKVVDEIKAKEDGIFDTSNIDPEKLKLIEGELIDSGDNQKLGGDKSNTEILGELDDETDPFDTGFAADIVKEPEDPFDTSIVKVAEKEEDPEFDPFDTTVAEKVIPVRKPKVSQRAIISVEDDDFDPETSFKVKKARRPPPPAPGQEVDPFSLSEEDKTLPAVGVLKPVSGQPIISPQISQEDKNKQDIKGLEEEFIGGELKHSLTDDDFDPRAEEPGKTFNEPVSDLSEEEGDDPFDTSAVQF